MAKGSQMQPGEIMFKLLDMIHSILEKRILSVKYTIDSKISVGDLYRRRITIEIEYLVVDGEIPIL